MGAVKFENFTCSTVQQPVNDKARYPPPVSVLHVTADIPPNATLSCVTVADASKGESTVMR